MSKTPYARIMEAALSGSGVRLSHEECVDLSLDHAITEAATNDGWRAPPAGLQERIITAYRDAPKVANGRDYQAMLRACFPADKYPRAWNYSHNGGPPGCAMAFGRAIREMGSRIDERSGVRFVVLGREGGEV